MSFKFFLGGDDLAIRTQTRSITYTQFSNDIRRACNALNEEALQSCCAYSFAGEDAYRALIWAFASAQLGKMFLPLNPQFTAEYRKSITSSFEGLCDLTEHELSSSDQWLERTFDVHKPWLVLMTSGSTGKPKGVVHSFSSLKHAAQSSIAFYDFKEGDTWLQSLGMFHIGGFMTAMRTLLGRGCLLMMGAAGDVKNQISQNPVDFISLVPTQLSDILRDDKAVSSLEKSKAVLVGGASCPTVLLDEALEKRVPISVCYGSSETGAQFLATKPGEPAKSVGYLGRLMPGRKARFVDGDFQVSDEACYLGYYGDVLKSPNSVVKIPDHIRVDDGEYFFKGRKDSVFQSGGENISPEDIEQRLSIFDKEASILILELEDDRLGKVPQLLYMSERKPDLHKLIEFIRESLPRFKRPRKILYTDPPSLDSKIVRKNFQAKADRALFDCLWEGFIK